MAHNKEERTLTRAEMEIMNILWEADAPMTTHAIIERMPDPKPAYSTVATFLKILCTKEFVNFRKVEGAGKTHEFFPMMSREFYAQIYERGKALPLWWFAEVAHIVLYRGRGTQR